MHDLRSSPATVAIRPRGFLLEIADNLRASWPANPQALEGFDLDDAADLLAIKHLVLWHGAAMLHKDGVRKSQLHRVEEGWQRAQRAADHILEV